MSKHTQERISIFFAMRKGGVVLNELLEILLVRLKKQHVYQFVCTVC